MIDFFHKTLKKCTDSRGGILLPLNFEDIDFIPNRMFVVSDVPKNSIRGEHAHYTTKQILLCVRGDIIVGFDDSISQKEVLLKQGDWVYMDKLTWGYQKFLSDDNIMVVLASTKHNKDDYITNKQEFYSIIGDMK